MNSKGQVLVVFVIILPILLLLLALVIDYGILSVETRGINNNIKMALEEESVEDIKVLLEKNIKDSTIEVNESDNEIIVDVVKNYKGILFFKNKKINIKYIKGKDTKRIVKG